MKLNNLFIFSFILIGLVSSLIGGIAYYYTAQKVMNDEIGNSLFAISYSRAEHIQTYLDQNIERLKLVTSRNQLRVILEEYNKNPGQDKLEGIESIINSAKESVSEIERICVLSLDGIVLTSTNKSFCGKDLSDKDFFKKSKEKETIYFVKEDGFLKIFVSGPFILNGKLIGVGITVLDLSTLSKIVNDRTGLGNTGEVLIMTNFENYPIFILDSFLKKDSLKNNLVYPIGEPSKQALLGNELIFKDVLDYRNVSVIAATQYLDLANLGLVVKMDISEVKSLYQKPLFLNSFFIGILILLISFIVGFFISRKLTFPLKDLSSKVDLITQGHLDISLENSNVFEIQNLIDSVNRILASLKLAILRTGVTKDELGLGEIIKAKEEAENKYKTIFEKSNESVFLLSSSGKDKGKILEVNETASKMHGYSKEELLKMNITDLDIPESKKFSSKRFSQIEQGNWIGGETYHKKKDGTIFPIEWHAGPLKIGDTLYTLAFSRDISDRKEYQDRYKMILDNIEDIIYSYDSSGKITFVSSNFSEYGYTEKDVIGKSLMKFIYPGDRKRVMNDLKETLKTGKIFPTLFRLMKKKGGYVYAEEIGKLVKEKGKFIGVNGTIRINKKMTPKQYEETISKLKGKKK